MTLTDADKLPLKPVLILKGYIMIEITAVKLQQASLTLYLDGGAHIQH